MLPWRGMLKPLRLMTCLRFGHRGNCGISACTLHHPSNERSSAVANRYSLAIINKTSPGNTCKSSGTPSSSSGTWMSGNTEIPKGNTGKQSAIFEPRPTADNMSRDRSHVLYSGSRAFPSSLFDPSKRGGMGGGIPPPFRPLPEGLCAPSYGSI